jgi:hypothetical protein
LDGSVYSGATTTMVVEIGTKKKMRASQHFSSKHYSTPRSYDGTDQSEVDARVGLFSLQQGGDIPPVRESVLGLIRAVHGEEEPETDGEVPGREHGLRPALHVGGVELHVLPTVTDSPLPGVLRPGVEHSVLQGGGDDRERRGV